MRLVGRDREMAAVGLLLDRAAAGTGGVLVVYGPPGAGRTALAEAAAGEGWRRGFAVARVAVAATGPARMAWAQLIRQTGGPAAVARRSGIPVLRSPAGKVTVPDTGVVVQVMRAGCQSGMSSGLLTTTPNRSPIAARLAACSAAAGTGAPSGPGSSLVAVALATTVGW